MSKHKNLKRNLLICLLAGSAVMYTLPLHAATSVIANNTLPSGGQFIHGEGNIASSGLEMNITQNGQNAVIKWNDFSVGGNATVNFDYTGKDNFNTLNYVNSGKVSQIYGTINAQHEGYNGNIFIVNTAGVQIGPSAQINVGSLHVSNKYLNESELGDFAGKITPEMINTGKNADAVLMSLGNINAGEVTFEGNGRIVIDSERIKDEAGNDKIGYKNINITTSADNTDNIIIGYDGYDATIDKDTGKAIGYAGANGNTEKDRLVTINGNDYFTKADGYMWVEDVEQLQAINTNLRGNYALRNSIDATSTEQKDFISIGSDNSKAFTGNFDGIDYNIFGLTIKNGGENTGLFGYTNNATISNVTLVGGSITGSNNVGAVVGNANNTILNNVVNSAAVSGNSNVGGIVGTADGTTVENAINTGTIEGNSTRETNVGGLIGEMKDSDTADNYKSQIIGNSYNLGDVSGNGYNVGGLVGHAVNSTIGDGTNLVYNRMDVTGAYNVGGIVGNMEGSTVKYAENSGTVLATGHTTEDYIYHTAITLQDNIPNGGRLDDAKDIAEVIVDVANVGGIAGTSAAKEGKASKITNVTNSGDVSSSKVAGEEYYAAGNVGGVVGRAEDTDITNATNKENDVRGAHNVGGIAGYFGSSKGDETGENVPRYTVTSDINDGGDIMATGARRNGNFVQELVRRVADGSNEKFTVGNIGGVVGYMDGYNVYVTGSANRGTVHTSEPADPKNVKDWEKAANVGGIVGKIDRSDTKGLTEIKNNTSLAAVNNSYNTGDVLGYTGVGGVVGMMYNGEVAGSYNLGYISTTRQSTPGGSIDALNMGGVVGDTTENANAKGVVIYDVYNKGQIGDSEFNYYGRHVGGIVGRLSGTVEKAYNNGAIYNGYNVVGGIAGWMAQGKIENAFNTGNITVLNKNNAQSQVGGIVGAANVATESIEINNVYNLGTLRSFRADSNSGVNTLGGIIGQINEFNGNGVNTFTISNAYTTGNLMMYKLFGGSYVEDLGGDQFEINGTNYISSIGSIYGLNTIGGDNDSLKVENTYYIRPQDKLGFTDLYDTNDRENDRDNSNKAIAFVNKHLPGEYQYSDASGIHSLTFTTQSDGDVDGGSDVTASDDNWRIYNGNTPILNAFLPDSEKYFSGESGEKDPMKGISSIQYGTAYDPLLTIIKADGTGDLSYNWKDLGITNAAGIAVYGAGLTLDNFKAYGATGYFGGTIYADGALNINGVKNDIGIGSAADIYGSAVNITTDGKVTIYGDVTATGNTANGATSDTLDKIKVDGAGNININAGDVDVYGTLTSAEQGSSVVVSGIEDQAVQGWKPGLDIGNEEEVMSDIADRFAHTTGASDVDGNITINAGTKLVVDDDGNPILDAEGNKQYVNIGDGNVNLYFGNKEQGLITTGGDLTVTGTGDVYVDSDLDIGGDMTLTSTGADSEVVLDITNIGQVQAKNELAENTDSKVTAAEKLHDFMHHFSNNKGDGANIYLNAKNSNDTKITVDMWDGEKFDLKKFDTEDADGIAHEFKTEIDSMNVTVNKKKLDGTENIYVKDYTYIWVSDGEQLKGIQQSAEGNNNFLDFNFALKNDINASDIGNGYEAIGGTTGYNGTFDGRGNRIIGLTVSGENAGIFSTVGDGGVVKDVNIYSGTFTGSSNAGAVAGVNNGRIEGIVTFGNTVTVTDEDGNAGGIVGVNYSGTFEDDANDGELTNGIYDVESTGSVIAGNADAVAGGLVGTNDGGLANSFSDSAVTVATGVTLDKDTTALGGVVGINNGNVQYVDSLGVTNGGATNSSNIGGIIGTNNGNMYSGYNESIVSGKDNVGGIIGKNDGGINYTVEEDGTVTWSKGTVENVVNATGVTGTGNNVGGLLGTNIGSVENGRNNGTIAGNEYVGGLVGSNAQGATLKNLVNDSSAAITGEQYVGGIAGDNAGTITTGNEETDETVNLINRGTITGQQYVGGVAGRNSGTITNANNDVELNVKDKNQTAKYFGGIAGVNTGTINKATNTADVNADGATYVGGIVGKNDGTLENMAGNSGNVNGKDYVGGVAGLNTNNKPLDGVEASNTGTVFATAGGAGGIFAVNNANITNSKLTNNGTVIGNSGNGTGGIFGVNTGNISTSSLINEVDGQVIGTNNVGGLIGKNTGTITGGRDDADSFYKYQIYNNGVINVGTWNDDNSNGKVDDGEIKGLQQGETSQNIGGLIGNNTTENGKTGSLTAGYNTGAINASGSTNVGGIAGSNSGKIDQVFNTVMVKPEDKNNGQAEAITGATNVGGLVGYNEVNGEITNAYNTSTVTATGVSGNLVGTNSGTVQYVYGVANDLIGSGTGSIKNYHVIDGSDKWLQEGTYAGFRFGAKGWKIYDGSTLPMLSVFLTKVTVVDQHLVDQYFSAKHYGEFHQITADDIKALIAIGAISAPDGFGAFNNNNSLIQGVGDDAMANSGNWLYSDQIADSFVNGIFNPNNLGYDISLVYSPFELDNDPSSRWNYLFNDAPFDRNKDFRERKAEVNFVDGGMEI